MEHPHTLCSQRLFIYLNDETNYALEHYIFEEWNYIFTLDMSSVGMLWKKQYLYACIKGFVMCLMRDGNSLVVTTLYKFFYLYHSIFPPSEFELFTCRINFELEFCFQFSF